uniref:CYP97A1 n=1 Tax=Parachlorella kessleri TaxID=3074 RepID=R9T999_PARKE|nr:CYP97A1 [Parachlorella kessleri]
MDTSALFVQKPGHISGQPVHRKKPAGLSQRSRRLQTSQGRQERLVVAAIGSEGKDKAKLKLGENLDDRIMSGEFSDVGSTKERLTRPLRKLLAQDPIGPGRVLALALARVGQRWRTAAARRMPVARGDIREIIGQPVFIPLFKLYQVYGGIFKLSFGPKNFVVVSDPQITKQILLTNAGAHSKGLLSEILDFVMGTGLIPADGQIWRSRRRAIVPSLHKKYIAAMVELFGDCALRGTAVLERAAAEGKAVEMENFFSRFALDIIGKAVFNYEFDSLTTDDPVIQAVYTTLREAEYRSTAFIPYWNIKPLLYLVPRQRRCLEALQIISDTLDELIAKCKRLVEEEDEEFVEEFLSQADPSILHFLVASGEEITSKQLRDDLMTLLIAGHETTAAVLTWTFSCIADRPDVVARIREEVDRVIGDRKPGIEDIRNLRFTARCIAESQRLYPQPPVLIRRSLEPDTLAGFEIQEGQDIFIATWNLHRSPQLWDRPDEFDPDRFGPLEGPAPNEVTEDFKYLPFGGGKRKCIGDQFAIFESVTALAMLVRRFDFAFAPDAPPVSMTTGATIHTTNGLWLCPKPRADLEEVRQREAAAAQGGNSAAAVAHEEPAAAGAASSAGGCPLQTAAAAAAAVSASFWAAWGWADGSWM